MSGTSFLLGAAALCALACLGAAEVFTAMADMELLLGAESRVQSIIDQYIESEKRRLSKLKDFAREYEQRNAEALKLGSDYIANPVNAFLLIKRLTNDWGHVEYLMRNNMADEFLANITAHRLGVTPVKFPTKEDMDGAAVALLRLQDVYRLDAGDMAAGKIQGVHRADPLTAGDCYELGRVAYNLADYYHTLIWMQQAFELWEKEPEGQKSAVIDDLLEHLAFAMYQQGNLKRALLLTRRLADLAPNHPRAAGNVKWYLDEMSTAGIKDDKDMPPLVNMRAGNDGVPERDAYEALCRGESVMSEKARAKLYCYWKRDRPFLRLGPIKVEIVLHNPMAVLFHDVLSDDEVQTIKELATPRLNRATVHNKATGELEYASYRISKSAWLKHEEHPVVARVNHRLDLMTNLNMQTAEDLQVANYGIGGHYDVHFDMSTKEETNAFKGLGTGNRIATVLFYHSALFWYNLLRDGEGDSRTRHAACPVLAGTKWVSNKWIHERGQEFRRPCNTRPDDAMVAPLEPLCVRLGVDHAALSVVLLEVGTGTMSYVFGFYYVKVFLNHYHITEPWFQFAQALFMVWNAVNDPLFGYMQDMPGWGWSWMRSRRKSILYSSPLYVASFLMFWFPWADYGATPQPPAWVAGMHLLVALFCFDGVLSFALLAWSALFAELTVDPVRRVRLLKYHQVVALFSVNSIGFIEWSSDSLRNYGLFQAVNILIGVIALFAMTYTGLYAPDDAAQSLQQQQGGSDKLKPPSADAQASWGSVGRTTCEIMGSADFHRVTWCNFLHISRGAALGSFAAIFTEALISRSVLPLGSWQISVFYWLCSVVPQIAVIATSSLIVRHGSQRYFVFGLWATVACSVGVALLGRHDPYVVLGYMFLCSVFTRFASSLFNVLFSELVDADTRQFQRAAPVSSLIFSLNALCTKPAHSIAPMFVTHALVSYGYNEYKLLAQASGALGSSARNASSLADPAALDDTLDSQVWDCPQFAPLKDVMFTLLWSVPLVLALGEYLLLRGYTLKDKYREGPIGEKGARPDEIESLLKMAEDQIL